MNSKIKDLTRDELFDISGGGFYKQIFWRDGELWARIYWKDEGER